MISAIVATYRRLEVLKRTLPTVLQQDISADEYEVVVVVDGPDSATCGWLESLPANGRFAVVQQDHLGLAAARNTGLRKASGDIALLLDDDLLCDPRLVRMHAEAHRKGCMVALGPVFVSEESPRTITTRWTRSARVARAANLAKFGPNWPTDIAVCANHSAPRELLLSSGGFDESLVGACEEFDLGIRLRKTGVEFKYLPDAVTSEIYVKTADSMVQNDCQARGRNEVRLCRKHPEYRPVSALAGFNQGSPIMRGLRYAAVRAPFSLEAVMAPMYRAAEAASDIALANRLAIRLLEFRRGSALFRSAKKETGSWSAFRSEFSMRLPVLLYHHVGRPKPGAYPQLTVSPENFEAQLEWLSRRGYTTIGPADWIAYCQLGTPLPPKPMLITFDDGYEDLAQHAFPALKRRGMRAIVFLVARCIGKSNEWDIGIWSLLPLLNDAQIREWSGQGIEFGSHTIKHPDLTKLSPKQLEEELAGSSKELEQTLGAAPKTLAYPFGSYDERVSECAGQNFDLSFTTEPGINSLASDRTMMSRLEVLPNDTVASFATMITCGYRPIKELRDRVAIRSRVKAAARRLLG